MGKCSNYSKWKSSRKRLNDEYDRPGLADKAEKKYCSKKTHLGKKKTLRDKRK